MKLQLGQPMEAAQRPVRRGGAQGGHLARTAALLALLVLGACGLPGPRGGQGDAGASGPAAPAAGRAPAAGPAPGAGGFSNPVIDRDFPDPDSLRVGDTYYAYATNAAGSNVQTARSSDLVRWQPLRDALPTLPAWSRPGFVWAPEVTTAAGGAYVMYFTSRHTASGRQCIGAATSSTPEGPFAPWGDAPLICQLDQGGSIDAGAFRDDDGSRYVVWKNDGNCCGIETQIYIERVSDDGLTLAGAGTPLLRADRAWEGFLVEAPTLWKHGGRYYLFYSANRYTGAEYAVGWAVAESITGPYQKAEAPLLASSTESGPVIGPGGQDVVVTPDGRSWMLYHTWDPRTLAYRGLSIDELVWQDGVPVVKGPNRKPQRAS